MLQLSASTRNINSRCLRGNKPTKKEERDSGKNKSIDSSPADTSSEKQLSSTQQTSSINLKKDQVYQRDSWRRGEQGQGHSPNSPATSLNIVSKKEERDIFQVECYNCHWKRHYFNKCSQNPKEKSKN